MSDQPKHNYFYLLPLLVATVIFYLIINSTVDYTSGDSRLNLLTSQAILEDGTIQLNAQLEDHNINEILRGQWMLTERGGKYYNFYPLGPSVVALPFVWLANRSGMDMANLEHDRSLQKILAGIAIALVFLLLYFIARLYLNRVVALVLATLFVLGTSLISTLGTALWTHNYAVLFVLWSLYLLLRSEQGRSLNYWGVGVLLFFAAWCRPTAAVYVLVVGVYLFLYHRKHCWKTIVAAASLAGLLVWFYMAEIGQALPDYYFSHSHGVSMDRDFFKALEGHLFSAGRGLFAFSPLLLLTLATFLHRSIRKHRWFWLLWGWTIAHLCLISAYPMWWGGWAFGARLTIELLPALFVLLALLVKANGGLLLTGLRQQLQTGVLLVLGLAGTWVHAHQGLYNIDTYFWNGAPSIDHYPQYTIFHCNYPQYLATASSNAAKQLEFETLMKLSAVNYLKEQEDLPVLMQLDGITKSFQQTLEQYKYPGRESFYYHLEEVEAPAFYFHESMYAAVEATNKYSITPVNEPLTLGEFLFKHSDNIVLLAVRDEAAQALSDTTKSYLNTLGGSLPTLDYRGSYAAIIWRGTLLKDQVNNHGGAVLDTTIARQHYHLESGGGDFGNKAAIQLNYINYAPNSRGINVVVLDPNADLLYYTVFDTHVKDREKGVFLKATLKE